MIFSGLDRAIARSSPRVGPPLIANAIYSNISSHFEGSYFIQNIREESEKPASGLAGFRRELLSTLLDVGNMKIDIPKIGLNFERRRLSRMKVLIVFDDVTCIQQIELLIGGLDRLDCFMPGSRIIITTRDAQLPKNLPGSHVGHVFEVKELSYNDSLTLFSRNAFGQNHPAAGYLELSDIVIKYVNGVPLALKVLGRHLFGRSEEEWESAIKKLSRIPHMDIQKVLKNLAALKRLNLSYCKQLSRIPDLSLALNLEWLDLVGCASLIEIHSSIQHLNKLVFLNLGRCISLKSLPTGINLDSLKVLYLGGCSNLKRFLEISCNIENLDLSETAIEELPSSIGNLSRLVRLDLTNCSRLKSVSNSLCNLKSLQYLFLSGCLKLEKLPEEIGNLESLKIMLANETAISQVPPSITCLNRNLVDMSLVDCGITELPESLGRSPSLKFLNLAENDFEKIPSSIKQLSNLLFLTLQNCKRLQSLPELPCGSNIFARYCTSLETLSNLSTLFTRSSELWQAFDFCNCFKLNRNEIGEIVDGALKKIQVMATWWKQQDPVTLYEDYHNPPRGCVSYPGSEIPEWFSYQSMGSSVTLELPPGWVNNNFVGFALCAIVPDHHGDTRGFTVRCILKTKDDIAVCFLYVWEDYFGVNSSIESDHVLLGYDFSVSSDSFGGSNSEFCIQFYIQHFEGPGIEGFDVKKCGAHLIYVQDPSKRLRSEVEDYQVLHPKRLKYP
ncbi:Disease resistance-like protein DSC1 [Citrus sinensis]|uniref:Disease resistance-like protein DSC1 n=1 Tax=Citrus sinensis TaxID=2711 RepID=A0ACB8HY25_CITSI|nr:Disease resistance-like protein DSC1 [Citrus sinensis]